MEEVIRKLNNNLRKQAPDFEIKYYNNKYTQNKQLFQFKKKYPKHKLKYVYYQTNIEKEAVMEYKRILNDIAGNNS